MNPIIATEILKGYKKPPYDDDYFIETPDKKYAVYFYNVEEPKMMQTFAKVAIFAGGKFDSPVANSDKIWIWYSTKFSYAQKSACLIFIAPEMKKTVSQFRFHPPYLLIKPGTRQFSFIEWDFTSIYYSLDEVSENVLVVKEEKPKDFFDRYNYAIRTGEMIDLNALTWYDFTQLDDAQEIYVNS
jgi:hypothetical protein